MLCFGTPANVDLGLGQCTHEWTVGLNCCLAFTGCGDLERMYNFHMIPECFLGESC